MRKVKWSWSLMIAGVKLVRTRRFLPFVVYRIAVGVLVLGVAAVRHGAGVSGAR